MHLHIFDYDNTLAKPQSKPSKEVLTELKRILKYNYIAIMSGGRTVKELQNLLIQPLLEENANNLSNLYICTSYGNLIHKFDKKENNFCLIVKSEDMKEEEKKEILEILEKIDWVEYGVNTTYGKQITDKKSYISVDCLGIDSPSSLKVKWDKNGEIRSSIKGEIEKNLSFPINIYITGRNTLDLVPEESTKLSNTKKLIKLLNLNLNKVTYTGDELKPNGNDYPLLLLKDIKTNYVNNPKETVVLMKEM